MNRDFLFVQSTTEVGGAETVLLNTLAASQKLRERSAVATLGFGNGDLPQRLSALGVEVVQVEAGRLRHPLGVAGTIRRLAGVARQLNTRVAVGNGTHPQVYAGLLAAVAGLRSVYYVHAIYRRPLRKNHPIDILALRGPCDLALANSKASMQAIRALRRGLRVDLLYPGVELSSVTSTEMERRRSELGAGSGSVLFGAFGRLQHWKGQDVFVEAAAKVIATLPEARFAIVGGSVFGLEPEFEKALRVRAAKLGLGQRITFTGFRKDIPELMAACDVICHTSRVPEPFGMVVIEAMAAERPVIATDAGGPSEFVRDGVCGRLVPPDDATSLANAMLELGKESALRERLGRAGRTLVETEFRAERTAEELLFYLESVLE